MQYFQSKAITDLLDAFGFTYITAAMEAEAECARLNAVGIVDAVWTDDIDAFLYGARKIIRNVKTTDRKPKYPFYTIDNVTAKTELTRNGMIFVALASGSDYDKNGIKGLGVNSAVALAQNGYGDELVNAFTESSEALDAFKTQLSEEVRNAEKASTVFKQQRPSFNDIPSTWPNKLALKEFLTPSTIDANELAEFQQEVQLKYETWSTLRVDLKQLVDVVRREFGWSWDKTETRIRRTLLPALRLHYLRADIHRNMNEQAVTITTENGEPKLVYPDSSLIANITKRRNHPSLAYKIEWSEENYLDEIFVTRRAYNQHSSPNTRSRRSSRSPSPTNSSDNETLFSSPKSPSESEQSPEKQSTIDPLTGRDASDMELWLDGRFIRAAVPILAASFDEAKDTSTKTKKSPKKTLAAPSDNLRIEHFFGTPMDGTGTVKKRKRRSSREDSDNDNSPLSQKVSGAVKKAKVDSKTKLSLSDMREMDEMTMTQMSKKKGKSRLVARQEVVEEDEDDIALKSDSDASSVGDFRFEMDAEVNPFLDNSKKGKGKAKSTEVINLVSSDSDSDEGPIDLDRVLSTPQRQPSTSTPKTTVKNASTIATTSSKPATLATPAGKFKQSTIRSFFTPSRPSPSADSSIMMTPFSRAQVSDKKFSTAIFGGTPSKSTSKTKTSTSSNLTKTAAKKAKGFGGSGSWMAPVKYTPSGKYSTPKDDRKD